MGVLLIVVVVVVGLVFGGKVGEVGDLCFEVYVYFVCGVVVLFGDD